MIIGISTQKSVDDDDDDDFFFGGGSDQLCAHADKGSGGLNATVEVIIIK